MRRVWLVPLGAVLLGGAFLADRVVFSDHVSAVEIERVAADPEGRVLDVTFLIGVAPCSSPEGVRVEESAGEVRLTARRGSHGGTCPAVAIAHTERVTLDAPVGDRAVVDGATGERLDVDS